MRLVNLTPHPITIISDGGLKITIQNSGTVARVVHNRTDGTMKFELSEGIEMEINVQISENTRIEGLPEPREGVIYIVSTLVAQIAQRPDVIAPLTDHTAARDEAENIVGVRGFRMFVKNDVDNEC